MQPIEVFADISCPFTHVGLRRVIEERDRRGITRVVLRVRSWPLEVVNGAPLDGDAVAEKVDALRRQVATDLFAGFDPSTFPRTTLPALALAAAADRTDPTTGQGVALALRDLVFEQGVDVSDRGVLERLAEEHGVTVDLDDTSAVTADHAEGVRRGVVGSPHFFTPAGDFFCPVLDIGRDDTGRLLVRVDEQGFEAFVAACFV